MTLVKRNIIANFAAQGWASLMGLAFVPLYIKFLGIEAYGLIGFYIMLNTVFQLLDFGLSQTMNREMARYSAMPDKAGEARDLVWTLQAGYWCIGLLIGAGVLVLAPFIAGHWIKPGSVPVSTVQRAVTIMGLLAAVQWPLSFYDGGLMGLQKQVLSSSIRVGIATLASVGSVLILWKVSTTITAYFLWQMTVSALHVLLLTGFLWRSLPSAPRGPVFNPGLVRNIWKFAAGMSGIAVSATVLMQLDKVILSKLLTLDLFGYYTLAGTVSNAVPNLMVGPIFNALFPRFTALSATNDTAALKTLYHQASQLMAVVVLPVATVLVFFSRDVILLWTGNARTAGMSGPIVSVLVVGMALNALMVLPYTLQISHGWTSIGLRINTFFIITLVPAIYFLTVRYGPVGAASVWVILNSVYIAIGVPLTHRRLLPNEMGPWFREDILPPAFVVIATVGLARWIITSPLSPVTAVATLAGVLASSALAAALVAPEMRTWLFGQLAKLKSIKT